MGWVNKGSLKGPKGDPGGFDMSNLQEIRKEMGLGDTLGALPVENGGTGCTNADGIKKLVLQYPTDAELLEYLGLK